MFAIVQNVLFSPQSHSCCDTLTFYIAVIFGPVLLSFLWFSGTIAVGSTDTPNKEFWESKCTLIPASVAYITVTMGSVEDRFKPAAGETYCSMLVSNKQQAPVVEPSNKRMGDA